MKFALLFPAPLRIEVGGSSRSFGELKEAMEFLRTQKWHSNTHFERAR